MSELNREAFLSKKYETVKKVNIKDLGEVYIRQITGQEQHNFMMDNEAKKPNELSRVVVMGLANPDGSRMLKDGDVGEVAKMPALVLRSLERAITEFNLYTPDKIEEMAKN